MTKENIVISAVNFTSGGPLSVLKDCLFYANRNLSQHYNVVALVHSCKLFEGDGFANIEFIEFPDSVRSYKNRLRLEYIGFKGLSKRLKPYLWLSLHDITPNVDATIRAVYCHNPSPFYRPILREIILDKPFFLFTLFYKSFYRFNIKENDYVIVQQQWLRERFIDMFNLDPVKVVVSYPEVKPICRDGLSTRTNIREKYTFFYPSFPRVFKNFEVVLEAVNILNSCSLRDNFEVLITIDGSENSYAASLLEKYSGLENVRFLGLLSREDVYSMYENSDCLIFPSKLETWGLPLTEAKQFNLPILAADLPYAHETVGCYEKISFFDPLSPEELSNLMRGAIVKDAYGSVLSSTVPGMPFAENWASLFNILLKK